MKRHAYLVTAYDNFSVLRLLLELLDHPRNDIYLHVDAKADGFDVASIFGHFQASSIVVIPRRKVYWGDYTQVRAVLDLFKAAIPKEYGYYHLISGSDLPLRSQDEIHRFFDEHEGLEFVGFASRYKDEWVSVIHIFNRTLRAKGRAARVGRWLARHFVRLQRALRIDIRRRWPVEVKKGSDWFSITHDLATLLVAREAELERMFRWATVPSEFYLQTVVWNSPFRDRIYSLNNEPYATMRYVDWTRGSPYTLRAADFDDLIDSRYLFARKFDWTTDPEVVRRVSRYVQFGEDDDPGVNRVGP